MIFFILGAERRWPTMTTWTFPWPPGVTSQTGLTWTAWPARAPASSGSTWRPGWSRGTPKPGRPSTASRTSLCSKTVTEMWRSGLRRPSNFKQKNFEWFQDLGYLWNSRHVSRAECVYNNQAKGIIVLCLFGIVSKQVLWYIDPKLKIKEVRKVFSFHYGHYPPFDDVCDIFRSKHRSYSTSAST